MFFQHMSEDQQVEQRCQHRCEQCLESNLVKAQQLLIQQSVESRAGSWLPSLASQLQKHIFEIRFLGVQISDNRAVRAQRIHHIGDCIVAPVQLQHQFIILPALDLALPASGAAGLPGFRCAP